MFTAMRAERMQGLHFFSDQASGLEAIVAIHNTHLGPALGGCRYLPYNSLDEAVADAMRLARGMSYKAALAGLEALCLSGCGMVTDVGMESVAKLTRLRSLDLSGCEITDMGVVALSSLHHLRELIPWYSFPVKLEQQCLGSVYHLNLRFETKTVNKSGLII